MARGGRYPLVAQIAPAPQISSGSICSSPAARQRMQRLPRSEPGRAAANIMRHNPSSHAKHHRVQPENLDAPETRRRTIGRAIAALSRQHRARVAPRAARSGGPETRNAPAQGATNGLEREPEIIERRGGVTTSGSMQYASISCQLFPFRPIQRYIADRFPLIRRSDHFPRPIIHHRRRQPQNANYRAITCSVSQAFACLMPSAG